ncbi:MAG: PorT family protein [Bacteroidetes bacterium]|nr:PorT family protein [Bacteroidota bacterium]
MKCLLVTALICATATGVFAQNTKTDTVKTSRDTAKNDDDSDGEVNYGFGYRHHHHDNDYPRGFAGITFARFDLGYTTLIDNGSFNLSQKNQFLDYNQWKSSNVGFDVFQMGMKVNKNFRFYLSAGFDWTLIRLRNNITIQPSTPTLSWLPDSVHLHKNRFSSSYLRIPFSFDFHTSEDSRGNRFHFVFGPEAGLLLNRMVKQVSITDGKQKIDNGYHFTKFRYGTFFRMGYSGWGIFAKYYFNDMFEESPDQAGLRNFSFGLTFGF